MIALHQQWMVRIAARGCMIVPESTTHKNNAKRNEEISLALFALAGLIGLVGRSSVLPFGPGYEMVAIAENLARAGAFANPLMSIQSGPSAVAPPLYPIFLAALMKVISVPAILLWTVSLIGILANALTAALLPRLSLMLFEDVWPGAVASLFWLFSAQLFPAWDANITVPLLLFFCLFSGSTSDRSGFIRDGFVAGLLAGILFLLNPMTLLIFVPWLGHLVVSQKASLKRTVQYCCVVLATVVLVATPWIARNYLVFGKPVVRTGLGLNVYFSNNDCSGTNLYDDLHSGCATVYQPNYNLGEAQAFRDLGEFNYDRTRLAAAEEWMRSHPDRFIQLTFSRVGAFWFPGTFEHPFKAATIWLFTLLSIPGLVFMARRRVPFAGLALFVLFEYPLVYYVIVCDVRYRYPVLWLSLLPAGYFMVWLWQRIRMHWDTASA
jgi:hypothetical protein